METRAKVATRKTLRLALLGFAGVLILTGIALACAPEAPGGQDGGNAAATATPETTATATTEATATASVPPTVKPTSASQ